MNTTNPPAKADDDNTYENGGPSQALDITLKTNELNDLSRDVAEIDLDKLLDDGLLKELPVIKTIHAMWRFGRSINEAFFLKKLAVFLFELHETSVEQRRNIIYKIENEEEYANKVSEALVVIIDRLDDTIKLSIIGRLFKAVIEQNVDYQDFRRLAHTVNMCFGLDLIRLGKSWNGNDTKKYNTDQFLIFNITTTDFVAIMNDEMADETTNPKEENSRTSLTELGEKLLKYGLDKYH